MCLRYLLAGCAILCPQWLRAPKWQIRLCLQRCLVEKHPKIACAERDRQLRARLLVTLLAAARLLAFRPSAVCTTTCQTVRPRALATTQRSVESQSHRARLAHVRLRSNTQRNPTSRALYDKRCAKLSWLPLLELRGSILSQPVHDFGTHKGHCCQFARLKRCQGINKPLPPTADLPHALCATLDMRPCNTRLALCGRRRLGRRPA